MRGAACAGYRGLQRLRRPHTGPMRRLRAPMQPHALSPSPLWPHAPRTPSSPAVFCFENNPLVRKALEEPGAGRVLVVDAGASMRCAVLGDNLAANAQKNGWAVSSLRRVHSNVQGSHASCGSDAPRRCLQLCQLPLRLPVSHPSFWLHRASLSTAAFVTRRSSAHAIINHETTPNIRIHPTGHHCQRLHPRFRSHRHNATPGRQGARDAPAGAAGPAALHARCRTCRLCSACVGAAVTTPPPPAISLTHMHLCHTRHPLHPSSLQKSSKRDAGHRDVPVSFAGVTIKPGDWVYADADGILVAPHQLKL